MVGLLALLIFGDCNHCPPGKIKVAVFEMTGAGVDKELLTTVSDLLRLELAECIEYKVVEKECMTDTTGKMLTATTMEQAVEQSESLKVSYAVIGNITKLGNKLIISVSLVDRWSKQKVFTDKITSSNIEDLETVVKRLASGLCKREKASDRVTVETITEAEAKPKLRRESFHTVGLLLGYMFPMGGSYGKKIEGDIYGNGSPKIEGDVTEMPGGSIAYLYETPYYMGEVAYGFYKRSYSSLWGINFSGYKFLSLNDVSPFVGGGIGMGWGWNKVVVDTNYWVSGVSDTNWYYNTEPKGFDGLSLSLGGGIVAFRTYDFHFIVSIKYNIILASGGTPNGIILGFGVTYKQSQKGGCCIF